jgi:hypothetical protein
MFEFEDGNEEDDVGQGDSQRDEENERPAG